MATKFELMTVSEFDQYLQSTRFNRIVNIIQNHHTLQPSYTSFTGNNHLQLLKGMEQYHVTERGFSQIAQNLTTFPDGRIALCRPLERIPAGIVGANKGGICIEHLGNFDSGKDSMTQGHHEAIIAVNALLCREFRLTPTTDTIVYHHWYDLKTGKRTNGTGTTKSCPGTAFFAGNKVEDAQVHLIPAVTSALAGMIPAVPITPAIRTATITASSLNVRNGHRTDAKILKALGQGIMVQIFEEKDGWCRIHQTEPNWVYGKFLA